MITLVIIIVQTSEITHVSVLCISGIADFLSCSEVKTVISEICVAESGEVRTTISLVEIFVWVASIDRSDIHKMFTKLTVVIKDIVPYIRFVLGSWSVAVCWSEIAAHSSIRIIRLGILNCNATHLPYIITLVGEIIAFDILQRETAVHAESKTSQPRTFQKDVPFKSGGIVYIMVINRVGKHAP